MAEVLAGQQSSRPEADLTILLASLILGISGIAMFVAERRSRGTRVQSAMIGSGGVVKEKIVSKSPVNKGDRASSES